MCTARISTVPRCSEFHTWWKRQKSWIYGDAAPSSNYIHMTCISSWYRSMIHCRSYFCFLALFYSDALSATLAISTFLLFRFVCVVFSPADLSRQTSHFVSVPCCCLYLFFRSLCLHCLPVASLALILSSALLFSLSHKCVLVIFVCWSFVRYILFSFFLSLSLAALYLLLIYFDRCCCCAAVASSSSLYPNAPP